MAKLTPSKTIKKRRFKAWKNKYRKLFWLSLICNYALIGYYEQETILKYYERAKIVIEVFSGERQK